MPTSLFLDKQSAKRLALALQGTFTLHGITYARLYALRHKQTHFVTLKELAHISDFWFPQPISEILGDAIFQSKEVAE